MRRTLLAGLLLPMPAVVEAAADCSAAQTQLDMNACATRAAEAADAELNGLYRQMRERLRRDDHAATLLVAAQRGWIAYRDAECDFASTGVAGGSIHPMIYAGCVEDITRARIADFQRYLACEEGDLSCPLPPR